MPPVTTTTRTALITDRFIPSAKQIASIEGLPEYPFAEQVLDTIVRILSSRAS